jgi:hypothetical protein
VDKQLVGRKAISYLYDRLQKALDAKVGVAKPGQFRATKKKKMMTMPAPDNLNGFAPGSHWVPLVISYRQRREPRFAESESADRPRR